MQEFSSFQQRKIEEMNLLLDPPGRNAALPASSVYYSETLLDFKISYLRSFTATVFVGI